MSEPFQIQPYSRCDTEIVIYGPGQFRFEVDYDYDDREVVEPAMQKMVAILNKHWNDPAA